MRREKRRYLSEDQPVALIDRVGSMVTGNARTKAEFPGVVERSSVPRPRMLKGNDAGKGMSRKWRENRAESPVKRDSGIFQGDTMPNLHCHHCRDSRRRWKSVLFLPFDPSRRVYSMSTWTAFFIGPTILGVGVLAR